MMALVVSMRPAKAAQPVVTLIVTEDASRFPIRVDSIRVNGLSRTRLNVVRRELGFREGDTITKADFDLAINRLWNMTVFAHVHGHLLEEGGRNVVVLELEDRFTLNPLLSFGSGGDAFYFRVGATDANIAGRFLEAYALYQNFDGLHGALAYVRDPRLFDERVELTIHGERLVRPRPGFSDQRTLGAVELAALGERDRLRVGLRTSVFADRFVPPIEGRRVYPEETETFLFEPSFRLGRIDTERLRQRGVTFEARPALSPSFFGGTIEAIGFAAVGECWNFAARARAAATSAEEAQAHLQLYAGGLDLLRGYPDNYVRTKALAFVNFEARFIAFDSTWIALVRAAFIDVATARAPNGTPGALLSAGAGVRFVIPKLVASGLRADLAIPIATSLRGDEAGAYGPPTPAPDIGSLQSSFGVFQFF